MENGNYGTTNYRNPIKMCDWNHRFFLVELIEWLWAGIKSERENILRIWQGQRLKWHERRDGVVDASVKLQLSASKWSDSHLYHIPFTCDLSEIHLWNSFWVKSHEHLLHVSVQRGIVCCSFLCCFIIGVEQFKAYIVDASTHRST